MKKNESQYYLTSLGKFLIKNKNKFANDMSRKLKYKWDNYSFGCGNDEIEISINIKLIKGETTFEKRHR